MANLVIRNLPEGTKEQLRVNAVLAGLSLEAYARLILQEASRSEEIKPNNILEMINRYFGPQRGIELQLSTRGTKRSPVTFD